MSPQLAPSPVHPCHLPHRRRVSPTLQGAEGTGSGQGAPSASAESPCPEQGQGALDKRVMGDCPLSD